MFWLLSVRVNNEAVIKLSALRCIFIWRQRCCVFNIHWFFGMYSFSQLLHLYAVLFYFILFWSDVTAFLADLFIFLSLYLYLSLSFFRWVNLCELVFYGFDWMYSRHVFIYIIRSTCDIVFFLSLSLFSAPLFIVCFHWLHNPNDNRKISKRGSKELNEHYKNL